MTAYKSVRVTFFSNTLLVSWPRSPQQPFICKVGPEESQLNPVLPVKKGKKVTEVFPLTNKSLSLCVYSVRKCVSPTSSCVRDVTRGVQSGSCQTHASMLRWSHLMSAYCSQRELYCDHWLYQTMDNIICLKIKTKHCDCLWWWAAV